MHLLKYFDSLSLRPENAKEIKGLILDLAIRGRLTEEWRRENPEVESASVLLERIKEEKQKLIKEKKIRKGKTLPEIIKDETPFELPMKWIWTCLGNLGYTQTGSTPPKKNPEYYGIYIPFIGPADISNNSINYPESGLSKEGLKKGRLIPKGSLMMVCIGGSIGKCNVNSMDVSCNQQINTLTPIETESDYLKIIAQSPYFQTEVKADSYGLATPIISKGKWEIIYVPTPPLKEQKAIVQIVNQLMKEVDQLEGATTERVQLRQDFVQSSLHQLTSGNSQQAWSDLQPHFKSFFDTAESIDKLKEAILQLAVQGKLTKKWRAENPNVEPASVLLERIKEEKARLIKEKKIRKEKPLPEVTEEEIPFELPEGWIWCRFGEIILNIEAGKSPKCLPQPASEEQWGVIKMSAISWGKFNENENKTLPLDKEPFKDKTINEGDFILTRANTKELIAKSVIVHQGVRPKLLLNDKTLRIRLSSNIKPAFINEYNNGEIARQHYIEVSSGTSDSMKNISRENIKSLPIPLPPFSEQIAILRIVNHLTEFCDQLKIEIGNRNTLSKDFLQSSIREVMEKPESIS